jgi:hypothetical protein
MMALRLARAYTGREKIVRLREHFHGWNDSVTGQPAAEQTIPVSPGLPRGILDASIVIPQNDVATLERTLREESGVIAAMILEPTGARVAMSVADADVLRVTQALYGSAPSYSTFQSATADIAAHGETSYVTSAASQFTAMTDAQFSHLLIVNTGLSAFTELETALTYYITANEVGAVNNATVRSIITLQLTTLLSGLETVTGPQAIFNAAAVAFNTQMNSALIYSTDPAHLSSQPHANVDLVGVAQAGLEFS